MARGDLPCDSYGMIVKHSPRTALMTLGTAVAIVSMIGCANSTDDESSVDGVDGVEAEGDGEGAVGQTEQALYVWKRTRYYYRDINGCRREGERVRREYGGVAWQCRMAKDICESLGGKGATCSYQRTYVRVRD